MAWSGWLSSESRFTTGTPPAAAMRSSVACSKTRAPMAAW